jgi:hypothetical protein
MVAGMKTHRLSRRLTNKAERDGFTFVPKLRTSEERKGKRNQSIHFEDKEKKRKERGIKVKEKVTESESWERLWIFVR